MPREASRYDYARQNVYFVTVCVHLRECVLGEVRLDGVRLSEAGQAVAQAWDALATCFKTVTVDSLVVMPNHIHGLLALPRSDGASQPSQLEIVLRAFKAMSTLSCNGMLGRAGGRFWQTGYEEHPVYNDGELKLARQYIADDPSLWDDDAENPRAACG